MNIKEEITEKWEELYKRISKKSLMRIEEIARKYITHTAVTQDQNHDLEQNNDVYFTEQHNKRKDINKSMLKAKKRKRIVFKKISKLKEQMQNQITTETAVNLEEIRSDHPFKNVFYDNNDQNGDTKSVEEVFYGTETVFVPSQPKDDVEKLVDEICEDEREPIFINPTEIPAKDICTLSDPQFLTTPASLKAETVKMNSSIEKIIKPEEVIEPTNTDNLKLKDAFSKLKSKIKSKPIETQTLEPIGERNLYKAALLNQLCKSPFKKPFQKFNSNFYKPKIQIPSIDSDDELSMEFSYDMPVWAKNPRIIDVIRQQDHKELDVHFQNPTPINVYAMFPDVKNVTNDSPNKWNSMERDK